MELARTEIEDESREIRHRARNLLAVVAGNLECLAEGADDVEAAEMIADAREACGMLTSMIDALRERQRKLAR